MLLALVTVHPLPAAAALPQPVESNAQVPITLLSQSMYVDSANIAHVVGEVQNAGGVDAQFVSIAINEYDAGGTLLATDTTYPNVDILSPGERSGFTALVDRSQPQTAAFDHATVTTIDDQVASTPQNQWFATAVTGISTDSAGVEHIVGAVRNLNSTPAQFVQVAFTFLDASGNILDDDTVYVNTDSNSTVQPSSPVAGFELLRDPSQPMNFSTYEMVTQSDTAPAVGQRLVTQVYQDLLNRGTDPAGLAYWSNLVDSGQPRYWIALSLTSSTEYRGDQVQALYEKYLHRATDGTTSSGGEGFWVNYVAHGATFEQLAESLIGSDEYFYNRAGGNFATYVTTLYGDILGRVPDPGGLLYWVGRLQSGAPRYLVSASILVSTEGYQNLVRSVFQTFLRHQPDPGGLNFWTGLLQSGTRDETVIASITASDEYFAYAVTHTP